MCRPMGCGGGGRSWRQCPDCKEDYYGGNVHVGCTKRKIGTPHPNEAPSREPIVASGAIKELERMSDTMRSLLGTPRIGKA